MTLKILTALEKLHDGETLAETFLVVVSGCGSRSAACACLCAENSNDA